MELNNIKEIVLSYIATQKRPVTFKKISQECNVNPQDLKILLNNLLKNNEVVKLKSGKYSSINKLSLYTGTVDGNPDGYAFFIADESVIEDLFIPPNKLNGAVHGDRVAIRVEEYNGKKEAYVVKVLERRFKRLVGRVEKSKHFAYVIPFMKKFFYDIYIPNKYSTNLKNDEVVVCSIISYPEKRKNPEGKILKSLGQLDDPGIENKIVLEKYELTTNFPKTVKAELKNIAKSDNSYENRTDFRNLFTVTIDGENARDFDDAISVERNNNKYILYVHIADVAHYVRPNSAIDKEAYRRGTSIYFPEFAIPMLPEILSNELCSLKPEVDRLALTVKIEYDNQCNIIKIDFYESIINSNYRLTYNYVADVLDGRKNSCNSELLNMLKTAEELALKLSEKKKEKGMIDFELPEPEFIFDASGNLISIKPLERKISHRIIENFMLEANEVVSNFLEEKSDFSIFRVHGEPDRLKIIEFINMCKNFGIYIEEPKILNPKIIQNISDYIITTSYSYILSSILVRSMQRALYSTENIGHFGLASKSYTHFTSPIRRYPDLIIHRLLKKYLFNYSFEVNSDWLKKAAKHSSEMEEIADNAERDIQQYKKIKYLEKHSNDVFKGYINRVRASGFFVFVENLLLTGFVAISKLDDDYYIFDADASMLIGKHSGKRFRVGDIIEIVMDHINYDFLEVDFRLLQRPS
jgi:ribonuclease R